MRLPGNVGDGTDFLSMPEPCALEASTDASQCRCSNYVRSGDAGRTDPLLCLLDDLCTAEAVRLIRDSRRRLPMDETREKTPALVVVDSHRHTRHCERSVLVLVAGILRPTRAVVGRRG